MLRRWTDIRENLLRGIVRDFKFLSLSVPRERTYARRAQSSKAKTSRVLTPAEEYQALPDSRSQ